MGRLRRTGVALLCLLAAAAGCNRDATGPTPSPSTSSPPSASSPLSAPPPSADAPTPSAASAPITGPPPSSGTSAGPAVTGPTKPPGGNGIAAAPPCSAVKPAIDGTLTRARITRDAPGQVTTCFATGEVRGARVDAQILYGHNAGGAAVNAMTGAGCAAAAHPVELPYPTAVGCDNPTGAVHSGAGLGRADSFAVALVTVTDDTAGTATLRGAVTDTARKLAASVLDRVG